MAQQHLPEEAPDVCAVCRSAEFHNRTCDVREEGQCALDAYLPLIVDTIDDFLKERDPKASS